MLQLNIRHDFNEMCIPVSTVPNFSALRSAARGDLIVPRTRIQLDNHFVWLDESSGTVYHWTFVRHLHYQRSKTCSRHICSLVPTSLTVSRVRAANIVQRPCNDSSHVSAPYKLSCHYYYYFTYQTHLSVNTPQRNIQQNMPTNI